MADDFARHVARVVAAQLAEATGFDACQDSAVEILGDLLRRYLSSLSTSSHSYAELAGRSQSNLADVMLALEDLGVTPEDLHQHMQFRTSDVPFAHTLAQFPVHSQQALAPTFADRREPHGSHIPAFLPAFPDPHTYQHTPAYAGHATDPHKQRQNVLEAKQKAEAALNKLHQRMSSKSAQPGANPYMAAPAVEQLQPLPATAAAAGAAAAAAGTAAAAIASGEPADAGTQPLLLQVPQQQLRRPPSAAAGGGGGGSAALDEEDALFESAVVLRAFSSVLPPDVLAEQEARIAVSSGAADAGQQRGGKQQQRQQDAAANGGLSDDFDAVEEEGGRGMMDVDGGGADGNGSSMQGWLGWKQPGLAQQQDQQQLQPAQLLGPAGEAGAALLQFGGDPLAAGKAIALALAGRGRPPDAYAERLLKGGGRGGGGGYGSGQRQRKSKYDVDPATRQAEGILAASAEAMFAATTVGAGGGGGGAAAADPRLAEAFGVDGE